MAQKVLRGGMIGAGAWAGLQLNAWAGVNGAKIVALCDRHPDRRTPIVEHFNIPQAFDDFKAMLDNADLDFVDICTRPYSHVQLIRLAVERGLPLLCQKPFCTSLEEARQMVELCQNTGIRLMVNENYRWQVGYRKAKDLLKSGMLGRPYLARIISRAAITYPEFNSAQAYMADMPHLILYEIGTHFLDTLRFLFGEPESVYARLHKISPAIKGEDVLMAIINFPGLTCQIDASWASAPILGEVEPPPSLQIEGTGGTLLLKQSGWMHLFTHTDHHEWLFPTEGSGETRDLTAATATQQHFIDCLTNGAEFETSGALTLKTMALVYACYRSAQEGKVVVTNDRNHCA